MASAIQLTAADSIINGQGLATSANLLTQISTLQAHTPITFIANLFATATSNIGISGNVVNALAQLGSGVTKGQWLIDIYPGNVTAVSTAGASFYGNGGPPASFSGTLKAQALLPFANGMAGFANVYGTASGYASSVFDTVSSVYLLQGKTYAQSGLGYTGPEQLATNGLGNTVPLLSNVISAWGTMYDINNIATAGDPYVFGQNLLNQGFGTYGNLSTQLSNAGLNVNNLSQVPANSTTTSQQAGTVVVSTPIGSIELPTINNVTTTTSVSGNSTDVVLSIYQSIVGADLQAIVTAANITVANAAVGSLADYLNFNTVTDPSILAQLNTFGITDFASFGQFLQSKIGRGYFKSWNDLSNLLLSLEVPTVSYTTANANTVVLSNTIANSLLSTLGTGSGPFNNPILVDYLGAVAGIPYSSLLSTLNSNYTTLSNSINLTALVQALDASVSNYVYVNQDYVSVQNNVNAVNSALNSLTNTTALLLSETAFYTSLSTLATEVSNLVRAGVVFNSGYPQALHSFAQRIGSIASDKTQNQTYQFFANLVTNDTAGDTVRLAVAESINSGKLAAKGISTTNDPAPSNMIYQSNAQGIPLSTYISQNK